MLRTLALAALAAATLATPATARTSALSPADAAKTVCADRLDHAGKPTGEQICKTGREWEIAFRQTAEARKQVFAPMPVFSRPVLANYGTGNAWRY